MEKYLLLFLITYFLSACGTAQSVYKPAKNSGFGYTEKNLGENHYKIECKLDDSVEVKARDCTIRRAAELTREQGYDWFVVIKHDTYTETDIKSPLDNFGSRQIVTRNCGLLGCSASTQTVPDFPRIEPVERVPVTAVLEVQLGKGIRPSSKNSYDANETLEKYAIKK